MDCASASSSSIVSSLDTFGITACIVSYGNALFQLITKIGLIGILNRPIQVHGTQ
jgi:hypothetical protein